jgi:hypothetical protein
MRLVESADRTVSTDATDAISEGDGEDGPWTVFAATPVKWTTAHADKLEQWKQGHLVADLPMTWLMPGGADAVTLIDNTQEIVAPAARSDVACEAAIICSQTCDIGAKTTPGIQHPYVLVAPLVHVSLIPSGETRNLAKEGKLGFLFPTLSPTGDNANDSWYADLRLIVPVSKAVLLERDPIEGMASEADSLSFGETLAQKFRRPALSEKLSDNLPDALRRFINGNGRNKRAFTKVEQVRLVVFERARLLPSRAQLIVIMDTELTEGEKELWQGLETETNTMMKAVGITMMPITFVLATKIETPLYRQAVPIWCDLLGFPKYP